MADERNYSFFNHNLRTPAMQSLNRPRLLNRRGSTENKLPSSNTVQNAAETQEGATVTGFVPHPPCSPRSTDGFERANSPRGKKRLRNDSPKTSSDDERVPPKSAAGFIRELPPLQRRGSSESLESPNSDRLMGSPLGARKRGLEPLKKFGTDKDLVNDFKSYQQRAKCNSPGTNSPSRNSTKPVKVDKESGEVLSREGTADAENATPPKCFQEPATVVMNGTLTGDDEDTLSLSDSFTSVSDSDTSLSQSECEGRERSVSSNHHYENVPAESADLRSFSRGDGDGNRTKNSDENNFLKSKRNPNSTLPTLPVNRKDEEMESNTSHLYDSVHPGTELAPPGWGLYDSVHPGSMPSSDVAGLKDNSNATGGVSDLVMSNSASDLRKINRALAKISTDDPNYVSDSEFSYTYTSQFSQLSQSSLLPRVNAQAARARNSNFLSQEMDKYVPERSIGVFVATWNMHEEKGLPFFLDDFLIPEPVEFLQDIYVIGSQESTSSRKEWEIKLQETLGPSHVLMRTCSFGVLHLAIFIRRELIWFCSAVREGNVATRPGHMIKTKGALAAAFSLFGTSFLFINSHFTSDEGKELDRVNDYHTICKSLSLSPDQGAASSDDITARFDRVFWLGDFNFRVSMERSKVDKLIQEYQIQEKPHCKELLKKDQLLNLMNEGKVFKGFQEANIEFLPSYKLDLQSDTYDTSPKMRVPSWTDRVLYRTQDTDSIKPMLYDACTSVKTSDHRPVFGIFEVKLNQCKEDAPLTGGQYVREVYIEANRRRLEGPKTNENSSVCTIL